MFSGEIYYTDPLIQLTKSLVKHRFSLHNLLRYSRSSHYVQQEYPDGRKANCLFSKQNTENMQVVLISNIYYIYLKIYFELCVTNDFKYILEVSCFKPLFDQMQRFKLRTQVMENNRYFAWNDIHSSNLRSFKKITRSFFYILPCLVIYALMLTCTYRSCQSCVHDK